MKEPRRWGELPHDHTAFGGSTDVNTALTWEPTVPRFLTVLLQASPPSQSPLEILKRREHHRVSMSSRVTERKPRTRKAAFLILSPGGVRCALVRNGASSSPWNVPHQHLTTSLAQSEFWVLTPSRGQSRAKSWNREDTRKDAITGCVFLKRRSQSFKKKVLLDLKFFMWWAIKNRNMGEALIENCPNSYYIKTVLINTA